MRGAGEQPYDLEQIDEWADRAVEVNRAGVDLFYGLMFELRRGIYHWHPHLARAGESGWRPHVVYIEGVDQVRPTPEELESWYTELTQDAPSDWWTWPRDRHAAQQRKPRPPQTPAP